MKTVREYSAVADHCLWQFLKQKNEFISNVFSCRNLKNSEFRKNKEKKDSYEYIRMERENVLDLLADVVCSLKIKSFLDVGCGLGNILYYVARKGHPHHLLNKLHGIEFDEDYCTVFENQLKYYIQRLSVTPKVFNINAFNFEKYDQYDFIYMYHPVYENKIDDLHNYVLDNMKSGAYFMEADPQLKVDSGKFTIREDIKKINRLVYQKL